MKKFTHMHLKEIRQSLDRENNCDLSTLKEQLNERIEILCSQDIESVIEYLINELDIESDMNFYLMNAGERDDFIDYLNDIISNTYGIE